MPRKKSVQSISVIVPANPFVAPGLQSIWHCLTALNVEKLMEWWPGAPHNPERDASKVRAIQRSLDWKRVAQIASYLLQREIIDVPEQIDKYFRSIYEPKKNDPGRQWPPKVPRVVGFERSEFPTFSNVLLHVNGAKVERMSGRTKNQVARLTFDENDRQLNFSVIDGQHRINGAYLAINMKKLEDRRAKWEIPSEIFLDLDPKGDPPRRQAQIFIDVNFYQKKVDRSLVADLFPTARGPRGPLDDKERAQDLGRKLMLEVGPLVGMIQIPGIGFGVPDVVTLATLTSSIEGIIDVMHRAKIVSLEDQANFLAQCLDAWLQATGRKIDPAGPRNLEPDNAVYQGRVISSFLTLLPACIITLRREKTLLISDEGVPVLMKWIRQLLKKAGLLERKKFLPKNKFRDKGFLGSGGIARLRDTLWAAALGNRQIARLSPDSLEYIAAKNREKVQRSLENGD